MTPMNSHTGTPDQVRAVVYVRQSKKREDDSHASPEAQRIKGEALIQARGWHHSGTFSDVGLSGWDPDVIRPEFNSMMDAARAGEIDVVVVFMLSRLTRRGALEAMKIHEELATHGVLLVSVEEPYLDTSTPMGVAIFGMLAALAQQESDMKSAYITATKETLRQAGGHVSGMAPYGFRSERVVRGELSVMRLVADPVEAPHVRQMVAWALEGETAGSIASKLTERQVPTKTTVLGDKGAAFLAARHKRGYSAPLEVTAWYATTVGRILRDPRLAGYALSGDGKKREILYADGAPLVAHEPLIPAADWWRLQDILNGRSPVPRRAKRSVVTLLAGHGLLRCGVCGQNMVADRRNAKDYYRCARPRGAVAGHGGLVIKRDLTDNLVAGAVWARLETLDHTDEADQVLMVAVAERFAVQKDTSERKAELAATRAELEHVRAALRTLRQDRQDGLYEGTDGRAQFVESVERLTASEARVGERVATLEAAGSDALSIPAEWTEPGEDPLGPGSLWDQWDITARREFLRLFLTEVRIGKSVGIGRHARTAERIELLWVNGEVQ